MVAHGAYQGLYCQGLYWVCWCSSYNYGICWVFYQLILYRIAFSHIFFLSDLSCNVACGLLSRLLICQEVNHSSSYQIPSCQDFPFFPCWFPLQFPIVNWLPSIGQFVSFDTKKLFFIKWACVAFITKSLVINILCFLVSDGFLNLFMVLTGCWLVDLFIVYEIVKFKTTYDLSQFGKVMIINLVLSLPFDMKGFEILW